MMGEAGWGSGRERLKGGIYIHRCMMRNDDSLTIYEKRSGTIPITKVVMEVYMYRLDISFVFFFSHSSLLPPFSPFVQYFSRHVQLPCPIIIVYSWSTLFFFAHC